jgi:hypothetical protein
MQKQKHHHSRRVTEGFIYLYNTKKRKTHLTVSETVGGKGPWHSSPVSWYLFIPSLSLSSGCGDHLVAIPPTIHPRLVAREAGSGCWVLVCGGGLVAGPSLRRCDGGCGSGHHPHPCHSALVLVIILSSFHLLSTHEQLLAWLGAGGVSSIRHVWPRVGGCCGGGHRHRRSHVIVS